MEVKKRLGVHYCKNEPAGTSLLVQWLTILASNAEGLGLTPDQGTRSHIPQLRVYMPQLKILHAATKSWHSLINKYVNLKNEPAEEI